MNDGSRMKSGQDELRLMADVRSMLFDIQEKLEERIVDENRKSRRRIIDDISAMSFDINNLSSQIRSRPETFQVFLADKLISRLDRLLNSNEFLSLADELTYKPSRVGNMSQRLRIPIGGVSVRRAIQDLRDYLGEYKVSDSDASDILSSADAPPQKPGPLQFDIVDGKISLSVKESLAHDRVLSEALLRLSTQGEALQESLRDSNADPRLQHFVAQHVSDIESGNIISIGVYNIQLGILCDAMAEELSPTVLGLLRGHIAAIGMLASQSEAWRLFLENASITHFDESSIAKISATADTIVQHLQANPEIVDEAVPKSFIALRELIADPKKMSGKVAFAVVRSIENLAARAYQHLQEYVEKTATKSVEGLATATSALLIGALTGAIIAGGTGLLGLNVPGLGWLGPVVAVVSAYINKTKPPS
jgi:hypothetical protein